MVETHVVYQTDLQGISAASLEGFFVGWRCPLAPSTHYEVLDKSEHRVIARDPQTGKVVGFINAFSDQRCFAFISLLEVLPNYQKRGIGTALVEKMLALLSHYQGVDLLCDEELQSFYQRFGMSKTQGMCIRRG